jgi:menaquinone-dependent protoporphyrinogen IX oxidase
MDIWWLHALTFIFGYVTCKTFYFINTARLSLKLLKSSRIIYLIMATRALENYATSEKIMKKHIAESGQDTETQTSFEQKFNQDKLTFKDSVIATLIAQTPTAFKEGIEFHDWSSAMIHLQRHRDEALKFWRIVR